MFTIKVYDNTNQSTLLAFLEKCLPESGRFLDIKQKHHVFLDIEYHFTRFWCLFDQDKLIGTVALRSLDDKNCELKTLYVLKEYHGKGLGYKLLNHAMTQAENMKYEKMYLDTLLDSDKAISLYKKAGFIITERYNENWNADIFMMYDIKNKSRKL